MKKTFAILFLVLAVVCSAYAKKEKKLKIAEMDAEDFYIQDAMKNKWEVVTLHNTVFMLDIYDSSVKMSISGAGINGTGDSFHKTVIWEFDKSKFKRAGMSGDEVDKLMMDSRPKYFLDNPNDFERLLINKPIYTVQLKINKVERTGYDLNYDVEIIKIEGGPSLEELNEKEAAAEKERAEKEAAQKKADEERRAVIDEKAKKIAKGYVYHGTEEEKSNVQLFANGALETGHAYLVSGVIISNYSNDFVNIILSFFRSEDNIHVKYIDQKTKGEVVGASKTGFGNMPVTIVVAGGDNATHTPVILGLVE